MRIKYLKKEYSKPVALKEPTLEETVASLANSFNVTENGVYLEGGSFQSPNFIKKAKGWMLGEDGKAWFQELFVGNDATYLSFSKLNGLELKGKMTITNPNDIIGSTINNDSGWTDDTSANNAQSTANNAQTDANTANGLLSDIASDGKITPVEKLTIKPLWQTIVNEKSGIDTQADTFSVSKVAYGNAYTALDTYLNTTIDIFQNMASTSDITRATWDTAWENYYNAKVAILQAIADATAGDITANNPQGVDWLTDAGLMAKEDAVEKAKLGDTILDGGYFKTGFVDADRIDTGILTGITIQTHLHATTGSKMVAGSGIHIYGETLQIFASATQYGTIGSGGAYFDIASVGGRNIRISTWAGSVYFGLDSDSGIAPLNSGDGNCGLPTQYWANVYANNYNLSTSYINYENSKITLHSDTQVTGSIFATGQISIGNTAGGSADTTGWRLVVSGTDLLIQQYYSGGWVTRSTIVGS